MPQADSKSSSGQEQQQTAQTVTYPSPYPRQFEDDSIDLYELWITLWNWKWLVIVATLAATLGSLIIALQKKTIVTYKIEALLIPSKAKYIQSDNMFGLPVNLGISPSSLFDEFKRNLISRSLHKKFIHENGLMERIAPESIEFENKNGITSVSTKFFDAVSAKNGAKWFNDLIKFVDKETIHQLVQNQRNSIANKIRDIEYTIASKRQMARQRRDDTIIQYEEAAFIAKKLGVMDRVDSTNIVQNIQRNVTTSNIPLYFRGYRALNAEILFLKNRVSDDPFISGLRDLQEQLALLRSINIDREKMRAVYIDQEAYLAKKDILIPPYKMIVFFGIVIGLVSGISLAFLIEFVQNQRKKHSE